MAKQDSVAAKCRKKIGEEREKWDVGVYAVGKFRDFNQLLFYCLRLLILRLFYALTLKHEYGPFHIGLRYSPSRERKCALPETVNCFVRFASIFRNVISESNFEAMKLYDFSLSILMKILLYSFHIALLRLYKTAKLYSGLAKLKLIYITNNKKEEKAIKTRLERLALQSRREWWRLKRIWFLSISSFRLSDIIFFLP